MGVDSGADQMGLGGAGRPVAHSGSEDVERARAYALLTGALCAEADCFAASIETRQTAGGRCVAPCLEAGAGGAPAMRGPMQAQRPVTLFRAPLPERSPGPGRV